jgi:hypothetical protein
MKIEDESKTLSEMLVGTWIGVSLIADALVSARLIDREALTAPLAEASMLARGQRLVPLLAMLWFIDNLPS